MKLLVAVALAGAVAAVAAQPAIPGAEVMGRGFDMIKGTQNGTGDGTVLLPVYQFHHTSGQQWTEPVTGITYAIPDELVLTNLDKSDELIDAGIMNSYQDWIHTMQKSFNVNAGVTVGSGTKALSANFKYNHESYQYKQNDVRNNAASGYSKHEWAMYQLESYPPELMTLNPMFVSFQNKLPSSIRSANDQKMYNQLVQYWGTHVPMMANFGGHVHVNTFVNKTFMDSHSQSWVANQFSITFKYYMFSISGGGNTNRSDYHVSQAFKDAATTYIFFKGGDITLQNNATVLQWSESIPKDPVYLNVTLNDLSSLVTDSNKARYLQNTIKSYIMTGKLPSTEDESFDFEAFHADMRRQIEREGEATPDMKRNLRG